MNIFYLHTNPETAAQRMCDQHINKMILESAQLLSTTVRLLHKKHGSSPPTTVLYQETHQSHPCTLWLLESRQNCEWLYDHCRELNNERFHRWDKNTDHQSMYVAARAMVCMDNMASIAPRWYSSPATVPRQVMPLEYTMEDNPIAAYRRYYELKNAQWLQQGKKPMTWTNRSDR